VIAAAGVVMQIALGAVYAWSVFRGPLTKEFGWTISEVTTTFTPSIFFLGLAAVFAWGAGRHRARLRLHRAGGHPGQVVPGQARHDHRHRRGHDGGRPRGDEEQ
jgi:hypothetical protein